MNKCRRWYHEAVISSIETYNKFHIDQGVVIYDEGDIVSDVE